MNIMQAVNIPQVIFGDISVCSEEYHSEYFIAAPSCDYDGQNRLIHKYLKKEFWKYIIHMIF